MNWQVENVATMFFTVALVLGLYWMSNSFHALWGLLLLLNMNSFPEYRRASRADQD